jgi:hypothetical protein
LTRFGLFFDFITISDDAHKVVVDVIIDAAKKVSSYFVVGHNIDKLECDSFALILHIMITLYAVGVNVLVFTYRFVPCIIFVC